MLQTRLLFVYSRPILNTMTNIVQLTLNGKSIDGVLGIRTLDRRMEGADESTELRRFPHPSILESVLANGNNKSCKGEMFLSIRSFLVACCCCLCNSNPDNNNNKWKWNEVMLKLCKTILCSSSRVGLRARVEGMKEKLRSQILKAFLFVIPAYLPR